MLLLSEVSRNLPLLTLSRHQSAFGFFLRKNMTLLFQPMMKKKAYFGAFFLLTYAWNSRWALGNWERNGVHQKISFPPSPLLLFLCFKKLRTTWTNIILTNSNIYLELTGYIFTKFFVKMISRNFLWNWVSSCCCLAGSASFECLSFFAFWLSQRLIVHFFSVCRYVIIFFWKNRGREITKNWRLIVVKNRRSSQRRCFFPSFHRRFYFPSENVLAKRGQVCFFGHRKHQMWPGRLFMTSFSFRIFLFRRTDIHVRQFCSLVGVMAIRFVGPMLSTYLFVNWIIVQNTICN